MPKSINRIIAHGSQKLRTKIAERNTSKLSSRVVLRGPQGWAEPAGGDRLPGRAERSPPRPLQLKPTRKDYS